MPRSYYHDYTARCIYHITMMKSPSMPPFGRIEGKLPDVTVNKSLLGRIIEQNLRNIPNLNPKLRILQYVIMPDHIHFLLFCTDILERHLGKYIGMFKVKCGQDYHPFNTSANPIFTEDFYDRILYKSRSLDAIFRYIRENPYRLAVRRDKPDFFRRVNRLKIGDKFYQAYGNVQLLENPFKEQVVVHRADTEEMRRRNRDLWLYTAANGGVLVSPFISPAEKAIRSEAEALNGKIILITNETFPERYKPSTHDFAFCELGRLLIIALTDSISFSRSSCLTMNTLASTISAS